MHTQQVEVELDIDTGSEEQNAEIEQLLTVVSLDAIAERTLQVASIAQPLMLSLLITGDETIHAMNLQYRQQDKATDVLSFPLLDTPLVHAPAEQLWQPISTNGDERENTSIEGNRPVQQSPPPFVTPPGMPTNLGDIVISWPTVQQQAQAADHSALYELLYLFSHGILHLLGYDDHSEAGYQTMVHIQEAVLRSTLREAKEK